MVKLRGLTIPLRVVGIICVITFFNELLLHLGLVPLHYLALDYQGYVLLSFSLYYVFIAMAMRPGLLRSLVFALGAVSIVTTAIIQLKHYYEDFPSITIVINSIAVILLCMFFISSRMRHPIVIRLSDDSHFLVVLLMLVYWSVFITKHALQASMIHEKVHLPFVEELFTWFSIGYYCGLGIILFRHKTIGDTAAAY